jgi:hypothetical protein
MSSTRLPNGHDGNKEITLVNILENEEYLAFIKPYMHHL